MEHEKYADTLRALRSYVAYGAVAFALRARLRIFFTCHFFIVVSPSVKKRAPNGARKNNPMSEDIGLFWRALRSSNPQPLVP